MLRNERVAVGLVPFNAKRVYRVMRKYALLMQRRPIPPQPQRRHDGKVAVARSNQSLVLGRLRVSLRQR